MTHYEALGIPTNATKDQIKRAYRKLSRKHHPDRGGSSESFNLVHEAYTVLSDDAKRTAYDRGDTVSSRPTNEVAERISFLGERFMEIIQKIINDGRDPVNFDLVSILRQSIEKDLKGFKNQKAEHEKALELTTKVIGRLKTTSGENFMAAYLASKIAQVHAAIGAITNAIAKAESYLEFLASYRFEFTPGAPQPVATWQRSAIATVFFSGGK